MPKPATARLTRDEPPSTPRCPTCDVLLTFVYTIIGGVVPVEHWDLFVCHQCYYDFEYRRRTDRLTRVNLKEPPRTLPNAASARPRR
jgi:hypothetical protein